MITTTQFSKETQLKFQTERYDFIHYLNISRIKIVTNGIKTQYIEVIKEINTSYNYI